MAWLRHSGPVVFERHAYGRHRRSWTLPRWLSWLLAGILVGAGGLYYLQEEYLPPRLTPAQSAALQARVQELDATRQGLQAERDAAQARLKASSAANEQLAGDLAGARKTVERLRNDLALFDQVLPPDPRGGTVGVRAARFANEDGQLAYHVLLSREQKSGKPLQGAMQLAVAGERGGRSETLTLGPLEVSLAGYQHLQGALPLPTGFQARQVTVRVLDGAGGRQLGTRVLNVR